MPSYTDSTVRSELASCCWYTIEFPLPAPGVIQFVHQVNTRADQSNLANFVARERYDQSNAVQRETFIKQHYSVNRTYDDKCGGILAHNSKYITSSTRFLQV